MGHLIKGLTTEGGSRHQFSIAGSKTWPLPENGKPGEWVEIPADDKREIRPHRFGIHLAKDNAAMSWSWERNFLAESEGPSVESPEVLVTRRARLVEEVTLSPEGWARLAVEAVRDIIALPEQIHYPWDHVKAAVDAYNITAENFGLDDLKHPWPENFPKLKQSPLRYAIAHADALIARSESDAVSTVEMGYNAEGVLQVAKAARLLLELKPGGAENWKIAREVAAHARKAASQFALQSELIAAEEKKNGITFPASIEAIFNAAGQDGREARLVAPAARIPRILLEKQSARLKKAWGIA